MSPVNTSTDGERDRNVKFEIVGDLVQTCKNCDAKHERTFNSAADLDKCWNKSRWKPGYRDLLSYVTFLLDW